jgi:site-specific recombinase XerD
MVGTTAHAEIEDASQAAHHPWVRIYKGQDTVLAQRDAAMLTLALAAGLRVEELHQLNVGDLAPDGELYRLQVRSGQGQRSRTIWLHARDAAIVLTYLAATGRSLAAGGDGTKPLWLSRRGTRLTERHILRILDAIADESRALGGIAGDKVVSPRTLRHTTAMKLVQGDPERGRRPATIMEAISLLGWGNLGTTQCDLEQLPEQPMGELALGILRRPSFGSNQQASSDAPTV